MGWFANESKKAWQVGRLPFVGNMSLAAKEEGLPTQGMPAEVVPIAKSGQQIGRKNNKESGVKRTLGKLSGPGYENGADDETVCTQGV